MATRLLVTVHRQVCAEERVSRLLLSSDQSTEYGLLSDVHCLESTYVLRKNSRWRGMSHVVLVLHVLLVFVLISHRPMGGCDGCA